MRIAKIIILLYFICSGSGCQPTSEPLSQPNIIWLNCEDLSPMLGAYGDAYATTPHLDQLAKQGVLYRNAYTSAPICAPARSCMVTGLPATSLGTQHLRSELKRPEFVKAIPEMMQQAGYFTSNYGKTDYNFEPEGFFDYWKQDLAPWRARADQIPRPFFSFFVFGITHEGSGNNLERYQRSVEDLPPSLFHDPDQAQVPPYYPDSPEFRELWAHYYDCATTLDRKVGEIVQNLKDDGLYDDTIIIFFSDHGNGLPRYKRWLNHSGLHVPFIVYVPEKYRYLVPDKPGSENHRLINFSDLAPTTLSLAGLEIPPHMQGIPFMGHTIGKPRKYNPATRSRADNMYEVSRALRDNRFIYIRHYMPHLPYIQPGYIFSDKKLSFKYLRKYREEGQLPPAAENMWQSKPVEELYDLANDPLELNNLAAQPAYQNRKEALKKALHEWILESRDVGFLFEPEMMIRGRSSTVYEMAQDRDQYDLPAILKAAEMVGTASLAELTAQLDHPDNGVRFWAVMGLQALGKEAQTSVEALNQKLSDPSPSVAILAAETLCHLNACSSRALDVLGNNLQDDRPWLALQAARSVELIEAKAKPLVPVLYQVLDKNKALPGSERSYKDGNFSAFTSWSVKWALHHCGESIDITW
ncbi:MAG: sulfatase-like hydrolase/transferase [Candidatus Cyclobacteriaceae bacterium M3_2C_046]